MNEQDFKSAYNNSKEQFSTATFIHLSTFIKYIFPFGNYIAPIIIWTYNKEKPFVDEHGRQAINFQLSMFIYTFIIGLACIPLMIYFAADFGSIIDQLEGSSSDLSFSSIRNISIFAWIFGVFLLLLIAQFFFELYAVINASIHASRGELYQYPLSISFIKTLSHKNQYK
ncbi:MAG TPA: DUF4870 domain-containing protein [Aequorivita sp.]|nr:DUF4870 domain-containing protein [Aequorivita sp.]